MNESPDDHKDLSVSQNLQQEVTLIVTVNPGYLTIVFEQHESSANNVGLKIFPHIL